MALTLFQRKSLSLGIVDPSNSVYNAASNSSNTSTNTSQNTEPLAIVFDAIMTEENSMENVGTTNPIETGAFVSDMIRTMPEKATFTAVISQATLNNFLGIQLTSSGSVLNNSNDRVTDAYNYIHDNIFVAKAVFDFVSGLKVYQTYYMSSFRVNRDSATGMVLSCTFTITQLNIVGTQVVNGLPPRPVSAPSSATGQVNQGQTGTQQATNFQQSLNTNAVTSYSVPAGPVTQTGNSFGGEIQ